MHFTLADGIGTVGVFLLLIAFLLNLVKRIRQESQIYFLLNCVGAGFACLASWMINYIPFVVLEGVWTIVSITALINFLRKRSK